MYSFLCNEDGKCSHCGANLLVNDSLTVDGQRLAAVNEAGLVVESIDDEGGWGDDPTLMLDNPHPLIVCSACGGEIDFTPDSEG